MYHMKNFVFAILILFCFSSVCFSMENVFYILRSNSPDRISSAESALSSLKKHYQSINILISQAYQIDENGMVWGDLDPSVADFSNEHKMKIMAMVTNAKFDKVKAHQFLLNKSAQKIAIESILAACQKHHYYGIQFDFEMIPLADRDALTAFYQAAAKTLHAQGLMVSFAVAPVVDDSPQHSYFLKRIYENWEGAYDLKALASSADFITVMAYNQHAGKTTPGSTAALPWVQTTIEYTLRFVPAAKISLGVPSYSNYWYTAKEGHSISAQMAGINFNQMRYLLQKYHASLQWDEKDKVHYAIYSHDWLNEYIFAEDAMSLKAKAELAEKYHLRGVSVFDLGSEDPEIWGVLKTQM
ncbi:MAG: glycosyl hydrolase family 18 protein [Gammaproteobacteria bacterium]|nr:glycosyl hydrolase family 18 protein [Gammaproteobacteria bacterium]